ncbi:DUF4372 domain-containing protein [Fulvivirga marina]|uniref:DUF4372 domain-containing protein n=1 Tax=Fulvivirga marina TaxID=2494733 RepID=UPI001EE1F903|nr:DUF4372 domain-containing protein [Fulvivirga marina]
MVSKLFCHFAKNTSVSDISNGLLSCNGKLNHLGVRKALSKSSVSYQSKRREAGLFKDLYYVLLKDLGQHLNRLTF